jgi:hypothetical protein
MAMHMNPNKLVAQATSSCSYIYVADNGKPAAIKALPNDVAAKALFTLSKYTSIMYI